MKRRDFNAILGCAAALPLAAWAQPRKPVIGYLVIANPEPSFSVFKEALRALGYVDQKNIQIELRNAEGKAERLAGLAAQLVKMKVDVLVTSQTPAATAAKQATSQIPIVMAGVGDPVRTGLITSLARPGGNLTGITGTTADLSVKLLELVRVLLPLAKRITVLANAPDPFTKPFLEQLQNAAVKMALDLSPIMIREAGELGAAFQEAVKRGTDVVIVQPSLPLGPAAGLAVKHRLPAVSPTASFPDRGGLMSYSANLAELQREAAAYVDKVLKGAKPADLPVQQPFKLDLIVNLKTAKEIGLAVPQSLLVRADRVIQ